MSLLVCCCASSVLAQSITEANKVSQSAAALKGLDSYVHKVMKRWQVPGLAIAVVKDGKVVLVKGYGVRELGKPGRVDADTLFTIGSNSKQFTAAALGTLVSTGKLSWDAPVVDYVKNFKLSSPYVTEHITLRDLLTHRSGYCGTYSVEAMSDSSDIVERLRYLKPVYGFRTHFCYSNLMYKVSARFIPAITGQSWSRYIKAHLFEPMDMTRTVSTRVALDASSNVAEPHAMVYGKVQSIERTWSRIADFYAPVGFINSSANDMSHWLLTLLGDGRYQGKSVLKPAVVQAMETPQMLMASDSGLGQIMRGTDPYSHFYSYGLGLIVQEYGKHKLVLHGGDVPGMTSAIVMVPDAKLGIVVLTNQTGDEAPWGVAFHVLQSYTGMPHRDLARITHTGELQGEKQHEAVEAKLTALRKPGTKAPQPLAAYAGLYSDDFDGKLRMSLEKGHLVMRFANPQYVGDLQYWHDNTFRVTWRNKANDSYLGKAWVTFDVDAFGKPDKLSFALMPLHYERVEDKTR
ncbi:MAG: serine hydrolase [Gammaproteobacteria bacterium]